MERGDKGAMRVSLKENKRLCSWLATIQSLERAWPRLTAVNDEQLTIIVTISTPSSPPIFFTAHWTIASRSFPSSIPVNEDLPEDLPTPRELYLKTWYSCS
jgi:hypothetical protein